MKVKLIGIKSRNYDFVDSKTSERVTGTSYDLICGELRSDLVNYVYTFRVKKDVYDIVKGLKFGDDIEIDLVPYGNKLTIRSVSIC